MPDLPSLPFDDDKLHEECGIFGMNGMPEAANFVALGLHALQHRGQEAGGIVSYAPESGFNQVRRFGYVRDNFTKASLMESLPGELAIGHVRYSTSGAKGQTAIRDVQPLFAELAMGGVAIAHNGNLTNAAALRKELIQHGSIFQSSSDSECIVHLMARSFQANIPERLKDALRRVEGAFSIVAMTRTKLIGARDAHGVRPLMLGQLNGAYVLASETCALDIIGAEFIREIEPGEMVVISGDRISSSFPFAPKPSKFCIFEHVYFSRPDSILGGRSVYETRRRIGEELAKEAPIDADYVCPVPDSGTPAAIGYAQQSGIPYAMGIIRNQYMGRTFIEPTEQIRNMGVRLKLNVNRALIKGKRVILVDDSVVRGTTTVKIREMFKDAGAAEVHFRIASPPTMWPCYYGVDTPERDKLLASSMTPKQMRKHLNVDSLEFISLDGMYRAVSDGQPRNNAQPQYCDACFSGEYPVPPSDQITAQKVPPSQPTLQFTESEPS